MRHTCDRRTFLQAAALGLTGARLSAAPPEGATLYTDLSQMDATWGLTYAFGS
jgi:hypothetical protein